MKGQPAAAERGSAFTNADRAGSAQHFHQAACAWLTRGDLEEVFQSEAGGSELMPVAVDQPAGVLAVCAPAAERDTGQRDVRAQALDVLRPRPRGSLRQNSPR